MRTPAKGKRHRAKKKPLRLSDADIAAIDVLVPSRYQQDGQEDPSAEAPPAHRVYYGKLLCKDPSWHFVRSRLSDVDDYDRVIDDLLDTDIPLSRKVRQYIKDNYRCAKRRESNRKRQVALIIRTCVDRLADWLRDDFRDPKTRAEEYYARHWRKVFGGGFSSGPALNTWMRKHLTRAKTPQKDRALTGARSVPTRADTY
jgi:hypothetical protein